MKKILITLMLLPTLSHANTQNHNVYLHKAGIDTSMYNKIEVPNFASTATQSALASQALASELKAKRQRKKDAEYAKDLIAATNGMKHINADNILPLIDKYPDRSNELLDLLKNSN